MDKAEIIAKIASGQMRADEGLKLLESLEESANGSRSARALISERKSPVPVSRTSLEKLLSALGFSPPSEKVDEFSQRISLMRVISTVALLDQCFLHFRGTTLEEHRAAINRFQESFRGVGATRTPYLAKLMAASIRVERAAMGSDGKADSRTSDDTRRSAFNGEANERSPTADAYSEGELHKIVICLSNVSEPIGPVLLSVKTGINESRLVQDILPALVRNGRLRVFGEGRKARYTLA